VASSRITRGRLFFGEDIGEDSFGIVIYRSSVEDGTTKRLYKTDVSNMSHSKKVAIYNRYKNILWTIDSLLYLRDAQELEEFGE
jgi:hypothetical protein